jgi:hypothetical protein
MKRRTPCATLLNGDQSGEVQRGASELEVQPHTNGVGQDFAIPLGGQGPALTHPQRLDLKPFDQLPIDRFNELTQPFEAGG